MKTVEQKRNTILTSIKKSEETEKEKFLFRRIYQRDL